MTVDNLSHYLYHSLAYLPFPQDSIRLVKRGCIHAWALTIATACKEDNDFATVFKICSPRTEVTVFPFSWPYRDRPANV